MDTADNAFLSKRSELASPERPLMFRLTNPAAQVAIMNHSAKKPMAWPAIFDGGSTHKIKSQTQINRDVNAETVLCQLVTAELKERSVKI